MTTVGWDLTWTASVRKEEFENELQSMTPAETEAQTIVTTEACRRFFCCCHYHQRGTWGMVLRLGSPGLVLLGSVPVWGGGVSSSSSALVSRCRRSFLLHPDWTSMVFYPQGVRGFIFFWRCHLKLSGGACGVPGEVVRGVVYALASSLWISASVLPSLVTVLLCGLFILQMCTFWWRSLWVLFLDGFVRMSSFLQIPLPQDKVVTAQPAFVQDGLTRHGVRSRGFRLERYVPRLGREIIIEITIKRSHSEATFRILFSFKNFLKDIGESSPGSSSVRFQKLGCFRTIYAESQDLDDRLSYFKLVSIVVTVVFKQSEYPLIIPSLTLCEKNSKVRFLGVIDIRTGDLNVNRDDIFKRETSLLLKQILKYNIDTRSSPPFSTYGPSIINSSGKPSSVWKWWIPVIGSRSPHCSEKEKEHKAEKKYILDQKRVR
ncbi:hypothetical protein Bca4012_084884 [Brassica carinata]